MGDWEFLYEMEEQGYGQDEIADAIACGYAPWQEQYINKKWLDSQLEEESEDDARSIKPSEPFQGRDGFPFSIQKQTKIFQDLVDCAARHFENTGRYLQIWGELGELYAEIKFGLCRHEPCTAGSDGTIAGKLVEVKTISPEKSSDRVVVKNQGNFEQLLIVRIYKNFQFKYKFLNRSELKGGAGKLLNGTF